MRKSSYGIGVEKSPCVGYLRGIRPTECIPQFNHVHVYTGLLTVRKQWLERLPPHSTPKSFLAHQLQSGVQKPRTGFSLGCRTSNTVQLALYVLYLYHFLI